MLMSSAPPLYSGFGKLSARFARPVLKAGRAYYFPISASSRVDGRAESEWPETACAAEKWSCAKRTRLWRCAKRLKNVWDLLSENCGLLQQLWNLLQLWRLLYQLRILLNQLRKLLNELRRLLSNLMSILHELRNLLRDLLQNGIAW